MRREKGGGRREGEGISKSRRLPTFMHRPSPTVEHREAPEEVARKRVVVVVVIFLVATISCVALPRHALHVGLGEEPVLAIHHSHLRLRGCVSTREFSLVFYTANGREGRWRKKIGVMPKQFIAQNSSTVTFAIASFIAAWHAPAPRSWSRPAFHPRGAPPPSSSSSSSPPPSWLWLAAHLRCDAAPFLTFPLLFLRA
jgi:hypothetical protein